MTQIINRLRTENEAASNILYDVRCSLFTILSAANMLQADYTPSAQHIAEAMEFLNYSIPDFANGSGYGWSAESALREVLSKINEYSLAFILDSMSTTLKEVQDDEVGAIDLVFLIGDIASLLSVRHLIPLTLRNKLEDLKLGLKVENEE